MRERALSDRYQATYNTEALADLAQASDWYGSRKVRGLRGRFARSVKAVAQRIEANPFAFAIRYKNVRFCRTDEFPYVLQFVVDETAMLITITAILYTGREPGVGASRV